MFTTPRRCAFALLLLCALPALAQYQTPTVNGSVADGEYAQTSGDWAMTWDATYLYVAKTNVTTGNGLVVYLDVDPLSTPAGGTNANGNLTGNSDPWTGGTNFTPDLPFRADARSLGGASNDELRTRDGSGGWTNVTTDTNDVQTVVDGTTAEVRIRWAAMLGSLSAPPTSFNWLAFEIRNSGGMTEAASTMPAANPGVGNARMPYFLSVAATGDGTSSNPFGTVQSTWKVTDNGDSGPGTLREAIANAEADGTATRRFIVFGSAVTTISLSTDLPQITKTTTIDGTSHPNWTADPIVVINSGGAMTGLDFASAFNCVIRGLHINNTFAERAIRISGGSGNTIAGNWLGLPAGGSLGSNGNNIILDGTADCTIGGTTAADRNVIAGAANRGIWIIGSSGTQVLGNYIGTDTTGNTAAGNITGVFVDDNSTGTVIGSAAAGNVIAASTDYGIYAFSETTILGNKIGVGADGSTALGNAELGINFDASNMTIGTLAAPNVIAHNPGAITGTSGGGLSIRGNSIFDSTVSGIDLSGSVEPTPVGSEAVIGESGLSIVVSAGTSSGTQSLRLDLYDADPADLSIPQPKTYRASSQCYAGATLNGVQWVVGSGYAPGDKLVLMVTSYSDANCLNVNAGTSEPSDVITAVAATTTALATSPATYAAPNENVTLTATISSAFGGITGEVVFIADGDPITGCEAVAIASNQAQCTTSWATFGTKMLSAVTQPTSNHAASFSATIPLTIARVFNGPGNFSVTGNWTGSTRPVTGDPFVIKGACTFDSASPVRTYGAMTLATGATVSWTTNHAVALSVASIAGAGANTINMTSGGVLRLSGAFDTSDVTLTRGTGTVVLSGDGQSLPSLSFNNLTVIGNVSGVVGETATVYGTLEVTASASLTPHAIEMRGSSIVNNGVLDPVTLTIPSGVTVSTSSSFGGSTTFTVNGTFLPAAAVVVTGSALSGSGTLKVTGTNASSSLANQYSFINKNTDTMTVEFAGAATQFVDNRLYGNLILNNASGLTTSGFAVASTGTLTLTAGVLSSELLGTVISINNPSTSAIVAGAGRLGRFIGLTWEVAAGSSTYTFPIGVAAGPTPVTMTFQSLPTAGQVRFYAFVTGDITPGADSGIDSARDVNLLWRAELNYDVSTLVDITLSYGGLVDGSANASTFVARRSIGSTSSWMTTTATPAATSITLTNMPRVAGSAINYFTVGNQRLDHYSVTASSPRTAGTPFTATVTAQDAINATVTDAGALVVTMTSNTGNAQFDSDGNGTFGDNTKTLTNGTFTISTKDSTPETVRLIATDTNGKTGMSSTITISPTMGAPAALSATATSTTQIALSWSAVSGATSYEIWRSSLNSGFAPIDTTSSTTYNDSGLTAGRTYVYKVLPVGGSSYSPTDAATTVMFTDPTSLSGVTVKAVHFTELGTAINAMRAAAGLTPTSFSTITAGSTLIARTHLTTMRTALDAARTALGLPALTYTDPSITAQVTKVKGAHVLELRSGVQ